MNDPPPPRLYRVHRVVRETHDTFTVHLEPPAEAGGFPFEPGQFNMLYLFGVGEVAISISGDASQPAELIHTIRAVGTVTSRLRQLRRGDVVGVRGPFGRGWPLAQAQGGDVIIVAGGLGLAPLRPVVYHLLRHRDQFRQVAILVGARTPDDLLYRGELERWRGRFDIRVLVSVDRAAPPWAGEVGVVPALIRRLEFDAAATTAMICGPEVMMRFTVWALEEERHLARERIFVSMERNMKCGVGLCGHCQIVPFFVCKDGPVFSFDRLAPFFNQREL